MGRTDALKDKIQKLGSKGKLSALLKYADAPEDDVRMAVANIPSYETGMALIPLLRDSSPMVRAAAATSAAEIHAKHCEEYVKKLAFADSDPNVRQVAKAAFDKLKDSVV